MEGDEVRQVDKKKTKKSESREGRKYVGERNGEMQVNGIGEKYKEERNREKKGDGTRKACKRGSRKGVTRKEMIKT